MTGEQTTGPGRVDAPAPAELPLLGGDPSLDFANTVVWRLGDRPREALAGYGDLLSWARHAGVLGAGPARSLGAAAAGRPADAVAALGRAHALREAIYRIFAAVAHGRAAPAADLARLNAALAAGMARAAVAPAGTGYRWGWDGPDADAGAGADGTLDPRTDLDLDRPLWPVARAAAGLLTGADPGRLRQCGGSGCGWLFLDTSRNGRRRWCDMRVCGNRARVRSHYARQRAARTAEVAVPITSD